MKYYLIAGEASGDLHASNLIKQLKMTDSDAVFRFWGGDLMASVSGETPIKHYRDLAFMGFIEVAKNIKTVLNNISFCKQDILSFSPDIVLFIDYPGFNLRIAEFAHKAGIKTAYYISPQLWAWKESRISIIKNYVDLMMVILPFEEAFYEKHNYKAHFVGHPLLDSVELREEKNIPKELAIALLPGSRKQEVERMLPTMLKAAEILKPQRILVAATTNLPVEVYKNIIGNFSVELIFNDMHLVLRMATGAFVTSGTATLETALLKVPQVVCYSTSNISFQIAKRLVKVDYISLVNLIMEKPVLKELIQKDMTSLDLATELRKVIYGGVNYNQLMEDYKLLPEKLGGKGASKRAAFLIFNYLNQ
ncbi:MAG: lipid-A-disaccharide synthase [Bacteroidales bacterium]|nr:lipid-A-disaccharide synthase [Bacteroidales bacterium]